VQKILVKNILIIFVLLNSTSVYNVSIYFLKHVIENYSYVHMHSTYVTTCNADNTHAEEELCEVKSNITYN